MVHTLKPGPVVRVETIRGSRKGGDNGYRGSHKGGDNGYRGSRKDGDNGSVIRAVVRVETLVTVAVVSVQKRITGTVVRA